jgi:F-type H+-transporting ATPase subunit alpha
MKNNQLQDTFSALRGKIQSVDTDNVRLRPAGVVVSLADGVARIKGLADARFGELLDIDGRARAIVLSLDEDEIGAVILGEEPVAAGALVYAGGAAVEVPTGEALLGRVVDPLGRPLDGLGKIEAGSSRPLEFPAPAIGDRAKVDAPLFTGILAVDSMIPIGKGQRELIIGDRQTGKTSVALDVILNQRGRDVLCVYVAVGQKASNVHHITRTLADFDALKYTTVVCATAASASPMQYIAPFAGCAIAEEFMYKGRDVLVVYDDLSKHAVAYRAMSLLLKRPPGREAYPGDVFYLHSRLLERAAKLSPQKGGGSMTALPIVETAAGDISAYIPTNVISITDGQIYLESELFNAGIRPAVNAGLSVSRVGSAAQAGAMKRMGGKLRLDLSQYRELAVFARFGSDLDAATTARLEHGKRVIEVLKQDVRAHLSPEKQTILLYITLKEILKKIAVADVRAFTAGLLAYIDAQYPHIVKNLSVAGDLSMDDGLALEDAVKAYSEIFYAGTANGR